MVWKKRYAKFKEKAKVFGERASKFGGHVANVTDKVGAKARGISKYVEDNPPPFTFGRPFAFQGRATEGAKRKKPRVRKKFKQYEKVIMYREVPRVRKKRKKKPEKVKRYDPFDMGF